MHKVGRVYIINLSRLNLILHERSRSYVNGGE